MRKAKFDPSLRRVDKKDTRWYDDLLDLYQRTRITELRNVLWENVKGLIYGRVHEFIRDRKTYLKRDPEMCQKLFQESFFIFQKACDIWDINRQTKFLTFLGDILDQEIMNIIRLESYHRTRDYKLKGRIKEDVLQIPEVRDEVDFERDELLEEVKRLMENYSFDSALERDIAFVMAYGKVGDWARLQKKSGMGIGKFYKLRLQVSKKLRDHIHTNCSTQLQAVLKDFLKEK